MVAAVSGWGLLNSVAESQQSLSNQSFPLVTSAHSLAAQSASVALLAPRIPQLRDHVSLELLYRQLDQHLRLMESIPVRIGRLQQTQSAETDLAVAIGKIRGQFSELNTIVSEKINLIGKRDVALGQVNTNISRIRKLIDQAITHQADLIFEQTETLYEKVDQKLSVEPLERLIRYSLDDQVYYALNLRASNLESLASSLSSSSSISEVNETKAQIDFQLRSMVSDVVGLSSEDSRQALSEELNELYRRLNSQSNLIVFELDLKEKNLEFEEIFGFLLNDVHQLNLIIGKLLKQAEVDAMTRSQQANETAKLSTNLSLLVVVLSIVVSAIAIVFIVRRVITPLQELTGNMHRLINNQPDVEVGDYSMIELGEMAYALKIFRDNSKALAARQEDLQNNNQLLSRVNHDLHAFVHIASHDLKSPLHGIRVLSDFVVDDLKQGNNADAESNLALLKQRITRMEQLIDSLLSYTQADEKSVQPSTVDVDSLIGEIFDLVNTEGKFSLRLVDDIPVCHVVESDLNIIFMNLLDNAISHHDRGFGKIDIRFSQNEQAYIFEVIDDGPGIESQYHGLIFEVLKTLKSRDVVEGSGVGLAHVKRVLESRGGSIEVVSDPQVKRGARFQIRYPRMEVAT